MTQISVTRALVELKRFDDKITSASSAKFVTRTVGRNANRKVVGSQESVEEATSKIRGAFDKVEALIKNRAALKAAIVLSNANTKVKILNQEMTVAEAIELKSTVALRQNLLRQLVLQVNAEQAAVDRDNQTLEASIDASLKTVYGADKVKVDAAQVSAIADPQKALKEAALLDPCDIRAKIEKLMEEVSEILTEVDFVLSESNARTVLDVNL